MPPARQKKARPGVDFCALDQGAGSSNENVEPRPGSPSAQIRPP